MEPGHGGWEGTAPTQGSASAIVYGRPFIANPDLVARFAKGIPLNAPHRPTFYADGKKEEGSIEGYVEGYEVKVPGSYYD